VECEPVCAEGRLRALAKCAGGRCDCAVFVARRGQASGRLWKGSLCLMLDGLAFGGDNAMIPTGRKWRGLECALDSSDFGGRTHHSRAPSSSSLFLQGSRLQPYHSGETRPKASTLPAPPPAPAHARSLSPNPPHITLILPPRLSLIPRPPPIPTQPPRSSQHPCARPTTPTTSFACDSPTKSETRSELRLLQLRFHLHLHFTCAESTRFSTRKCPLWRAEGGVRSGLLAG